MIETIRENNDYQKIDNAYIVNRNDSEYRAAISRRQRALKQVNFENRLIALEDKLDQIFNILMENK